MDNIGTYFHHNFFVMDMEKMIEFYEKGFGYKKCLDKMLENGQEKKRLVLLETGTKFLVEFLQNIEPAGKIGAKKGDLDSGPNHLGIPVKDINKKYEELKKLGMKWETEAPIDVPDAKIRICFGRDIEGNRIELLQSLE